MFFNELINHLKEGDSELIEYNVSQNPEIKGCASIDLAQNSQITFLDNKSYLINELKDSNASAILIPNEDDLKNIVIEKKIAWALFKYPKVAFAETLEILHPKYKQPEGIHPTAVIEKNVILGVDVKIGAHVYIGNDCQIGDESNIHAGVIIYQNVSIGSNTELQSNCVIHQNTVIGNGCVIKSNAVIGSEGFGYISTKKGWKKMPQTGKVILENFVDIGCNTNVDRPAVGSTKISEGTKIDNLVQVGHGVSIGKSCAMASQVGIAGGAKIGDFVIFAGQVGVGNRVNVGNNVIASSKCGIHTDIESGKTVSGFPALPNKLWLRCQANLKKLPEIAKTVSRIDKYINKV